MNPFFSCPGCFARNESRVGTGMTGDRNRRLNPSFSLWRRKSGPERKVRIRREVDEVKRSVGSFGN